MLWVTEPWVPPVLWVPYAGPAGTARCAHITHRVGVLASPGLRDVPFCPHKAQHFGVGVLLLEVPPVGPYTQS